MLLVLQECQSIMDAFHLLDSSSKICFTLSSFSYRSVARAKWIWGWKSDIYRHWGNATNLITEIKATSHSLLFQNAFVSLMIWAIMANWGDTRGSIIQITLLIYNALQVKLLESLSENNMYFNKRIHHSNYDFSKWESYVETI